MPQLNVATGTVSPGAFSNTTSAITTAYRREDNGQIERLHLVAFEEFGGVLDTSGQVSFGSSPVRFAYSVDDGSSWTRKSILPPTSGFGLHTLLGDLALASAPRVPPFEQGSVSVVFMFMVGEVGDFVAGTTDRVIAFAGSENGGIDFGPVRTPSIAPGSFIVNPSGLSAAYDVSGKMGLAYLSNAGEQGAGVRYVEITPDTASGNLSFSAPVNPVLGTQQELSEVRRVVLRDGVGGQELLVERVQILPEEEWTSEHDARLRLSIYRRNALTGGWDFAGTPTGVNPVFTFANVRSEVGDITTSSHVDFQRTLDRARATGIAPALAPFMLDGRSHIVWAGHDNDGSGSGDQVWYRSFATELVGAQGYQDVYRTRVRISMNQGGHVFQPTVSASGADVFVTWYEQVSVDNGQLPPRLRTRLLGRRSHDRGLTFGPVVALSGVGRQNGDDEGLCPTDELFAWSRFSTSLSYLDTYFSGTQTNPSLDLTATAVTFHTRGTTGDCSQQTRNSTLFQEAAWTRWR